jgi:DUF4097 and DUF4098 domain-containing protein YvlB
MKAQLGIVVFVVGILTLHGCICSNCSFMTAKFERTEKLSAPFESCQSSLFTLATHNGSITVSGRDCNKCEVTATIRTQAPTDAEARELAEKVKIALAQGGKQLAVNVTKPENLCDNRSISIDFDVTLPSKTALDLTSHNGAIHVANIIDALIKVTTHNGSINADEICGDIHLTTHNGAIKMSCIKSSKGSPNISAVTHNGNIRLEIPSDLSATIDAQTHNGSVSSTIPMTIKQSNKTVLQGTIGTGDAGISLATHNGSIKIMSYSK